LKGFHRVLEHLAGPLWKAGRIHLGQKVVCIEQPQQPQQQQQSSQQQTKSEKQNLCKVHTTTKTYICQKVIVTVPLGVLKSKMIEFRPSLPKSKQEAIDKIGFGLANKMFFEFKKPFWDPNCYGFGFMSGTKDRQFHVFINLMPLYGKPILFCPAVTATAEWIEKSSDEQVIESVLKTLKNIFGAEVERSNLVRHTITRWKSDELVGGAYSFFTVGCSDKEIQDISEPFGNIFFAGEHTHEDIGYAHGAFLTGWREAERFLNQRRGQFVPKKPNLTQSIVLSSKL